MCDTLVAVPPATSDGCVWFGKNSDREPGEAQLVEHLPRRKHSAAQVQCTWRSIPQTRRTNEVILSRPFWMWGAEMGANEHGVTIGNEAVFTRLPYAKNGLTGMDLLRLVLERTVTAREALELITDFINRYGQGGGCGYRNRNFRYHNSFLIADPHEAWVLETADRFWVAEQVRGIRTISNTLTIGSEFDLISPDTYPYARSRGWCRSAADFSFAQCFSDPHSNRTAGAIRRRACTWRSLQKNEGAPGFPDFAEALRDHGGMKLTQGHYTYMPCAHASWPKTRQSGQTTGSMISRLSALKGKTRHWLTGTSSPCLSVFKPVTIGRDLLFCGAVPAAGYDAASLFWQHERLHRLVMLHGIKSRNIIEPLRAELERTFHQLTESDGGVQQSCWPAHLNAVREWAKLISQEFKLIGRMTQFQQFWLRQSSLEGIPL